MKFSLQLSLLGALSIVDSTNASAKHVPARISYDDLAGGMDIHGDDIFWRSLHRVGLLSVTNIPDFNKEQMLKDLEDCLHRQNGVGAPDFNLDHLKSGDHHTSGEDNGRFRRRTLATRTLSGSPEGILVATKPQRDAEENADIVNMCGNLQASSQIFRNAVQGVSEAVAARFASMESLVIDGANNQKITIETLINKGEHLEHFHSYYSEDNQASSTPMDTTTIDWHTDQGMMLLFTPGQFQDGTTSDGFFIRLTDGSTAEVAFDSEIDDLVIMLGDGVNQYINDATDVPFLRAVPHAVRLPNERHSPRLWYGRMVLPPPKAIHPSGQGSTFDDIRTAMIRGDKDALSLGCATSDISARELMEDHFEDVGDEKACDAAVSLLCWMTCMSYEKKNVTVEACSSQSGEVVCANEDGQLWEMGEHNPAFTLRCLSSDQIEKTFTVSDTGMIPHMEHDHSGAAVSFGVTTGLLGTMIVMMAAMM